MDFLNTEFANNKVYVWLLAAFVVLVVLLLAHLVRVLVKRRVVSQAGRPPVGLITFLALLTAQTRPYFVITLAVVFGAYLLKLPAQASAILRMALITIFLIQVGFWGTHLINFWINRRIHQELERNNTNASTLSGMGMIVRIFFWSMLLLLILENITGMEVTTLIASLGITGVAVALAVQNILSDLFASLSITLDRPFVIGDTILVGEYTGQVEHVGLKSTRVRSVTGEQLIFSNSDLLSSRIRNYKRMERRRNVFYLDVTHDTPAEKLELIPGLVGQIISAQPDTTFDRAHFKEIGDSALRFEVVYFNENPDYLLYMNTQQAINLAIIRRFAEEGIEFAYPTQTVYNKELSGK